MKPAIENLVVGFHKKQLFTKNNFRRRIIIAKYFLFVWSFNGVLNPKQRSFGCNCRKKDSCPLNGECLTPEVIYRADITNEANNDQKFYFGLAETTFKERYNNHKGDVKHIKCQYNTELTKHIWNLKNNSIQYNIHSKVVDKVYGNANLTKCKLCLTERYFCIFILNLTNMLFLFNFR